jgi:hypothetical protein
LDFDVQPEPPVVGLVPPASDRGLFNLPTEVANGGRDNAARVVGTDCGALYRALAAVYADLGFDAVGDEVFADLVIARVTEPTSLLDAGRILQDLGREPASYATMKRTLTRADKEKYRDQIANLCFRHASASGDVSLVLYDVTTLLCRLRHNSVEPSSQPPRTTRSGTKPMGSGNVQTHLTPVISCSHQPLRHSPSTDSSPEASGSTSPTTSQSTKPTHTSSSPTTCQSSSTTVAAIKSAVQSLAVRME